MDQNPNVGIAGSRLEDPDGTPQQSAFRFQSAISEFERNLRFGVVTRLFHRWAVTPPVGDQTIETDWVAGGSMIIRRELFEDNGLLAEAEYTDVDDIDLCFDG